MTHTKVSKPTIILNNLRTSDKDDLHVLLTADGDPTVDGIEVGEVTALSGIANSRISFDTITSGRLYIGLGKFPNPPTPDGPDYFGWIEFTKTAADTCIWVNLTNVDLAGLPLALAGTDTSGKPFSLGLNAPMTGTPHKTTVLSKLEALLTPKQTAKIKTKTGQTKILSPTTSPHSYDSLEPYLETLCAASAPLSIRSDTPKEGKAVRFTGSFQKAGQPSDVAVSLTGDNGKTLEITKANLSGPILFRCDGGKLIYDGKIYPQNRTPGNDPGSDEDARTITNSTFRELMVGLNQGYFTKDGPNDNTQFAGLEAFASGHGNSFAKVIHELTNSYGYPYADSNLKVQVTAAVDRPLTLTIIPDTEAYGYSADAGAPQKNQPNSGTYQFGIGAGSGALGPIKIGNWVYPASKSGSFGGFLPDLPDWARLEFTGLGPGHYIYIRNGEIHEGSCLSAAVAWTDNVAQWPADLAWKTGTKPPCHPPAHAG